MLLQLCFYYVFMISKRLKYFSYVLCAIAKSYWVFTMQLVRDNVKK